MKNEILACMLVATLLTGSMIVYVGAGSGVESITSFNKTDNNLKLYYPFDNGIHIARDNSGNGYHGTCYGVRIVDTAKFGRAVRFDGDNDNIYYSGSSNLEFDVLTLEAWIFPETVSSHTNVISRAYYTASSPYYSYAIKINPGSSGKYKVTGVINTQGVERSITTTSELELFKWSHVAMTWDGNGGTGNIKVYVNGQLDVTSPDYTGSIWYRSEEVRIGMYETGNLEYKGLIDEVKIYNKALTPSDGLGECVLKWGFEERSGSNVRDLSGNGLDGTITNGNRVNPGMNYGYCLDLDTTDSSNDYVEVGSTSSLKFTKLFTLECYIKYTTFDSYQGIIGRFTTSSGDYKGYLLQMGATTGSIRLHLGTHEIDGEDTEITVSSTNTMVSGSWNHIAGIFDGYNQKAYVYVNGVETSSDVDISAINAPTTAKFTAGKTTYYGNQYLTAFLDDIRVYNCKKTIGGEVLKLDFPSTTNFEDDNSVYSFGGTTHGTGITRSNYYRDHGYVSLSDSYIDYGSRDEHKFTDEFSIELWLNPGDNSDTITGICGRFNRNNWDYQGYVIQYLKSSGQIRVHLGKNGGSERSISSGSSYTCPQNQWSHVLFYFDNGIAAIYINGVLANIGNIGVTSIIAPSSADFIVGRLYSDVSGYEFTGKIAELSVYNYAKHQTEDRDGDNMPDNYEIQRWSAGSEQFNYREYNGRFSILIAPGDSDTLSESFCDFWNDLTIQYDILMAHGYSEADVDVLFTNGNIPSSTNVDDPNDAINVASHSSMIDDKAGDTVTSDGLSDSFKKFGGTYLTKNDFFYFYYSGHLTGSDPLDYDVNLYLWDEIEIADSAFLGWGYFNQIYQSSASSKRYKNAVFCFDSCYAYGIISDLNFDGVVCLGASDYDELAYNCDDEGEFGEFSQYHSEALNWYSPYNSHSDADGVDGSSDDYLVSMYEVYTHIDNEESRPQTTQYEEFTTDLGKEIFL